MLGLVAIMPSWPPNWLFIWGTPDQLGLTAADDAKKLQFQMNVFWLEGRMNRPQKEDQDVTPEFASRSFMIIRSSMIIFGMVVGMSISTNAETVKLLDEASADGSFTIAQTRGQDRRDTRQDCRQEQGAVGADKRNCKQQGRQK
jgi:hypothetical protein